MRRTTPRPSNPYRPFFKQYADSQLLYEEILAEFHDYKIYGFLDNTDIHIVDADNKSVLFFEFIGYDDEDCVPSVYEASPIYLGRDICDIACIYADCFGKSDGKRLERSELK